MGATTLTEICRKHALWLQGKEGGVRAYLYGAELRETYLREADLRGADLCRADLCEANLCGADLRGADLLGASLYGANLYGANLRGADLCGVDLRRADLRGADLYAADLYEANLCEASLYRADLRRANLRAIRDAVRAVLDLAPAEVPGLLLALREGRVDRSRTIAHLGELTPSVDRPAECWFLAICKGYTPATHPVAAIAEEWIVEWLTEHGVQVVHGVPESED